MSESVENISIYSENDYNRLIKEYIDVIEKRDNLMLKKQTYLDAKHICMSYDLMINEIKLRIKVKKLKIEKNMIKSSLKSNKKLNKQAMNEIINRETITLENQINTMKELLNNAKECIGNYEKNKDLMDEISTIYKKMILKLSPTFNEPTKNKQNLWKKSEIAYIYNDINKLRIIDNLIEDKSKSYKTYDYEEIKNEIKRLKYEINNIKELFPLSIENEIDTLEYINNYRSEIKSRIYNLIEEEIVLSEEINILKSKVKRIVVC